MNVCHWLSGHVKLMFVTQDGSEHCSKCRLQHTQLHQFAFHSVCLDVQYRENHKLNYLFCRKSSKWFGCLRKVGNLFVYTLHCNIVNGPKKRHYDVMKWLKVSIQMVLQPTNIAVLCDHLNAPSDVAAKLMSCFPSSAWIGSGFSFDTLCDVVWVRFNTFSILTLWGSDITRQGSCCIESAAMSNIIHLFTKD